MVKGPMILLLDSRGLHGPDFSDRVQSRIWLQSRSSPACWKSHLSSADPALARADLYLTVQPKLTSAECSGFERHTDGFSVAHIHKFCLFTYLFNWKWALIDKSYAVSIDFILINHLKFLTYRHFVAHLYLLSLADIVFCRETTSRPFRIILCLMA